MNILVGLGSKLLKSRTTFKYGLDLHCPPRLNSTSSLSHILKQIENGSLLAKDAQQIILQNVSLDTAWNHQPIDEKLASFANLDHNRSRRAGFPEAIFGSGKTPAQIVAILDDMAYEVNQLVKDDKELTDESFHKAILATRIDEKCFQEISQIPLKNGVIKYHNTANLISMRASSLEAKEDNPTRRGRIVVSCAGTTDLPVAEEAAITLEIAGCNVDRIYDVGVAGLHRIINALPRLRHEEVDCVIVCAGMDGALPSVVAGLVSVPVVAVPTSIGYGASFSGVSAMLTMLNSCAPGVGVVNIDNGFGAAILAFKFINKKS